MKRGSCGPCASSPGAGTAARSRSPSGEKAVGHEHLGDRVVAEGVELGPPVRRSPPRTRSSWRTRSSAERTPRPSTRTCTTARCRGPARGTTAVGPRRRPPPATRRGEVGERLGLPPGDPVRLVDHQHGSGPYARCEIGALESAWRHQARQFRLGWRGERARPLVRGPGRPPRVGLPPLLVHQGHRAGGGLPGRRARARAGHAGARRGLRAGPPRPRPRPARHRGPRRRHLRPLRRAGPARRARRA